MNGIEPEPLDLALKRTSRKHEFNWSLPLKGMFFPDGIFGAAAQLDAMDIPTPSTDSPPTEIPLLEDTPPDEPPPPTES